MAIYTIRNIANGNVSNYIKEDAKAELVSLVTINDVIKNIHWKNKPFSVNANDNVYNIFKKSVDSFVDWIFETIPLNGVSMGFDQFAISASSVYVWNNTSYTKDELLDLLTRKEDDWFRMALNWFNRTNDYIMPFDLTWSHIFKQDFYHGDYNNDFSDRLLNEFWDYLGENLDYEIKENYFKLTNEDTGEITPVKTVE